LQRRYENVTRFTLIGMREPDYREIENAIAATLRVFLESKQKLNSFERACHEALVQVLADVVKRRSSKSDKAQTVLHEGR
jgi:hypothetical protein